MVRLDRSFFKQDTLTVAEELLGKNLVVSRGPDKMVGMVVETEAYIGKEDKACHAVKGMTKRTKVMWDKPGTLYVYLVYGIHYMLNVVTAAEGFPAAVLIRGLKPVENISQPLDGPGKLTQVLGIDKPINGVDSVTSDKIYFLATGYTPNKVIRTPRIGIDYAGRWAEKPWRFLIDNKV